MEKKNAYSLSDSKTFSMLKNSIFYKGHPYVDIGGIKWATMNVGAKEVTDYGLLFQWGDTKGYTAEQIGKGEGQKRFRWEDYKYDNGSTFTKYNNTDGLITLEATDDAVTAAWGRKWRMPTASEFQALRAAVTTEWVTDYQGSGVNGRLMTDKADSSKVLFFPACGRAYDGSIGDVGYFGFYWGSSLYGDCGGQIAYGLSFYGGGVSWQGNGYRYRGLAVRGVLGV